MWDWCGKKKKKSASKKKGEDPSWGAMVHYHVKKSIGGSLMVLVYLFTLALAMAALADQTQNHVVPMQAWTISLILLAVISLIAWATSAIQYARMGRVDEWTLAVTEGGKSVKPAGIEGAAIEWLEKAAGRLYTNAQFTLGARIIFWTSALIPNALALVHAGYLYWNAGSGDLLKSYTSYLDDGWPAASAYGTFPVYEKLQMLFWLQVAFYSETMSMVFWVIAALSTRLNESESLLHRALSTAPKLGTRLRSGKNKAKRVADTDSGNNSNQDSAVEVGSSSSNNSSEAEE